MQVQKSKRRRLVTLEAGAFVAREIRKRCSRDPTHPVMISERLARVVPPHQGYGYDLIVHVGLARYLKHRQREEIRSELLAEQGLVISEGSITELCERFLRLLERLHRQRTPALRAALNGGYPLHIDATSEHGKGGLFVCLEGWRGWVLHAVLRNLLRQSQVRTQLRELLRALPQHTTAEVYTATYGHGRLREDLFALLYWVLEGEGRKDLPYPFSLPHLEFYQRCQTALQRAERWLPLPRSHVERGILKQLAKVLVRFEELPRLAWAVSKLERGWQAFCELRDVLRLTDAELPRGDLRYLPTREFPELEKARLDEIEKTTTAYREQLRKRVTDAKRSSSAEAVILKYLDRYANHLFGHPVQRDEDGKIIAVVERTNNLAEHYFGTDKQKLRRRLGRAHLGRDLEDQPAQAALASNLRHGDYVRVLCGSLEHLPAAFAEVDQAQQDATPLQRSNRDTGLLKRIRALIADERQSKNDGIIDPHSRQLDHSATEI